MTMQKLSKEYKLHAETLSIRIGELEVAKCTACPIEREQIEGRIKMLSAMRDEANELARVTSGASCRLN